MSKIQVRKGEVGNSKLEARSSKLEARSSKLKGKFISPLEPDYVRGVLRRLFPSLCVSHKKPAYYNGKWWWDEGWWVAVQDGIYLLREGNDFNLYWQE